MERENILSTKLLYLNQLHFPCWHFLPFKKQTKKANDVKMNGGPTTSLSIRAAIISGVSSCSGYCLGFSTKERKIIKSSNLLPKHYQYR